MFWNVDDLLFNDKYVGGRTLRMHLYHILNVMIQVNFKGEKSELLPSMFDKCEWVNN